MGRKLAGEFKAAVGRDTLSYIFISYTVETLACRKAGEDLDLRYVHIYLGYVAVSCLPLRI